MSYPNPASSAGKQYLCSAIRLADTALLILPGSSQNLGLVTSATSQGLSAPQLPPSRVAAGEEEQEERDWSNKAAPGAGERSPALIHSLLTKSASQAPCCACMPAQPLSRVQLSATPWTVSPPGSSVYGIFQARILEWLPFLPPGNLSPPRDRTHVSCIGRWILWHFVIWEAQASCHYPANHISYHHVPSGYRLLG